MKSTKSGQSNPIEQLPRRRICTSWIVPLLLLWMPPGFGAQAAVVFTSLYSFTGGNDGGNPYAGLVQGSDGSFYGTTIGGGTNGLGNVFQISTNGAYTSLYSFTGGNDGANPVAGLVQGSDGYFYGTTSSTMFQMTPTGGLTTLVGQSSASALVQGSDGYFYGTTESGGTHYSGTVFNFSTNGVLTTLYSFSGGNDGGYPEAGLVRGSDGYFYGTTQNGGTNGYGGTVFKISTNGALSSLYSFFDGGGILPSGLVQGSDGYFYGTTEYNSSVPTPKGGRMEGYGNVFKISTNGVLTSLYSFTGGNDGAVPQAGLVQGSDGYFYGTTGGGGTYTNHGTVFKLSPTGALTTLYSFGSVLDTNGVPLDGANPLAGLVQGRDGNFYGTTSQGGTDNAGTVFRLTIVPQPQLTMTPSGPYVILTWPTNYSGFTLQSTTNLGSAAVWSTNSSPPVVIGGDDVVISTASGNQQFYRLSQ